MFSRCYGDALSSNRSTKATWPRGMLVVKKKGVHPGAKSTFYLLGPLVD